MMMMSQTQTFAGSTHRMPHAKHCTYLVSRDARKGPAAWVLALTYFTDEETVAQNAEVTCPRSHS